MGKNFRETLNEQMKDPEFRAEWEAQEPERQIMHAILKGRQNCNLTQEQLAQVTGINHTSHSCNRIPGPPALPPASLGQMQHTLLHSTR